MSIWTTPERDALRKTVHAFAEREPHRDGAQDAVRPAEQQHARALARDLRRAARRGEPAHLAREVFARHHGALLRERIDDNAADTGTASCERHNLNRHSEAHDAFAEFRAYPNGVRQHEITLQLFKLISIDAL